MAEDTKKISVKVWRPVLDKLERKIEGSCLRRDAYLNKVLDVELPLLDDEVSLPNSSEAHAFVANRLDQLDRKLVSLALRSDTVDRLNEICSRKRIVRDAFFNRVFLFLAASPQLVDRLLFPGLGDSWRTEVWSEYKHDGPFFQNTFYPLEQDIDPFWAVRAGIELTNDDSDLVDYICPDSGETVRVGQDVNGNVSPQTSFYTQLLHEKQLKDEDLFGLNCYVPNWLVPGHEAERTFRKQLDDLIDL